MSVEDKYPTAKLVPKCNKPSPPEDQEKEVQQALGVCPTTRFTLTQSIPITLNIDIILQIDAINYMDAIAQYKKASMTTLMKSARRSLLGLTNKSYSAQVSYREFKVRKLLAESIQNIDTPILCVDAEMDTKTDKK